jgi:hypothetical protein
MVRSSPFIIAAAVFVVAAGTASAHGTPEPGEAPEVAAERSAEEARPRRGERMRERMRDRRERHDRHERRQMRPRRGMGATMPGPGIEIQIGEDRLVITCGHRESTSQCVEAAMPIIEMFRDEVEELELDEVEDAEVPNEEED